jgi:aspartyl-tRNA(Asn)/glutamyl-tRNA(Gln) amidotransferase subunit A
MSKDPLSLPLARLLSLYQVRKLSPVAVTQAALARAELLNPALNAFCLLDAKTALQQARAAEKRWQAGKPKGALDGVPVTIKDWFHVKGWPTRFGAALSDDTPQKTDSPLVARLREAGAVFLGKTTLPEYGHKGVTDSPAFGITRNPWDLSKTSGGSSGGGAAAAAIGAGFLHFGSDAGGSVRIPASFCGVFAFKPSPGLVPSWPPSLFSTLSAVGPMTRCVADAAAALDVITQPDARDWHALPIAAPSFAKHLSTRLPKLRIAYAPMVNDIAMNDDVAAVMRSKISVLKKLGTVSTIKLDVPDLIDVFNKHWMAVASYMIAHYTPAQKKAADPRLLHWAARGDKLPLHDYLSAERARMAIGEYFKSILDDYDVLVTPTTAMAAFETGTNMPKNKKGKAWEDWTPFTYPANLAKLPAASLPLGLTQEGLPVGLQVMSGYLKDALLLKVCHQLEKEIAFQSWQMPDDMQLAD